MRTGDRTYPRLYDEDFNRRAVEMTLSGRGPTGVDRDLGAASKSKRFTGSRRNRER